MASSLSIHFRGVAFSRQIQAPILLIPATSLNPQVETYLKSGAVNKTFILGGEAVINNDAQNSD